MHLMSMGGDAMSGLIAAGIGVCIALVIKAFARR